MMNVCLGSSCASLPRRSVLAVCLACLVSHGSAFSVPCLGAARVCPPVSLSSSAASSSSRRRAALSDGELGVAESVGTARCSRNTFPLPCARGGARLAPLRAGSNEGAAGGGDEEQRKVDVVQRMANVPILGIFVRFARWVANLLQSILLVRVAVLLKSVAHLKTALLDPQRRLSAPGQAPQQTTAAAAATATTLASTAATAEKPLATGATQASLNTADVANTEEAEGGRTGADWEPVTSSEVAFQAFWNQMDTLSKYPSVQGELASLQLESARQRAVQEQVLAQASGVTLSVLDFVEHGGLPPSVEALTAWLEIRDINTSLWGCGEAKTVQEFFHELWAGESEPLGTATQRVISVVKVRILDNSEDGTYQLYETKQTLCRDGRTRPRNRPLAEKLRPGEKVEECCVRGVREELGSLVGLTSHVTIREGSMQQWEETRMSRSFPGLETLYKLYQVDVEVEGLSLKRTSEVFDTEEDPQLSTGKVHRWQWVPCGGVDWDPVSTV